MFSFFKKKPKGPWWSEFMNEDQYTALHDMLKKIMREYKFKSGYNQDDTNFWVHYGGDKPIRIDLFEMVKVLVQENQDKWYENLSKYFKEVFEPFERLLLIKEHKDDFEKLKDFVAVRIYDKEIMDYPESKKLVVKEFAPDLVMVLSFDLGDQLKSIKHSDIEAWQQDIDELFELGRKNAAKNNPITFEEVGIGPKKNKAMVTVTEHFFANNAILDHDLLKKSSGKFGVILALPYRHTCLMYPVNSGDVIADMNDLLAFAANAYNDESRPGPTTPFLYWFEDGEILKISYAVSDGRMQLMIHGELQKRLEKCCE
jgi:hypothetical protein